MNKCVPAATVFCALLSLAVLLGCGADAERPLATSVCLADDASQAVRQRALEFAGAFRTGQAAQSGVLEGMLADDFVQVGSDGQVYEGKAANLALYRKGIELIRSGFQEFHYDYEIRKVKVFAESALVFGKLLQTGTQTNGAKFRREVWETLVFEKDGKQWKLVHEHSIVAADKDTTRHGGTGSSSPAPVPPTAHTAPTQPDGIHAQLDRIQAAWAAHDAEALSRMLARQGFVGIVSRPGNPKGAWVGGKNDMIPLLAAS